MISVLAGHDVGDRPLDVGLEAQIAVRQDADQPPFLAAVFGDRHARDAVLLHQVERFEDPVGGGERDGVDDHPALGPLHPVHLRGLLVDRQILVNHAEAAVLRHRDRQARFGDRVHRGADNRHVEADPPRELRAHVHLIRQHGGMLRHQQDVVEGEGRGEPSLDRDHRRRVNF